MRGKGEAGGIVAVAFGFFLQNVQILDAFERKVLGEDKRDLFAPYQAQLGNGFAVFDVLYHFVGGQVLFGNFDDRNNIAYAFEFAIAVQFKTAFAMALQQPAGHQGRGRLFGVGQRGFQTAQGFAQFGQDVFRFGRGGIVDQKIPVARVENRLCAAAARKSTGQQIVSNLFFQLLFFLTADIARFVVLDFQNFFIQNIADHAGRQDFFFFFQGHAPSVIGREN